MKTKKFLTINEQINRLGSLGIKIQNRPKTESILMKNSYYNILNGYREPFLYLGNKTRYIRGVKFTEIYQLYYFDKQLRNVLFPALLDIENILKSQIVYEFLSTTNHNRELIHDGDAYLRIDSYDLNKSSNERNFSSAIGLISNLHKTISKNFKNSETISHYLTKYGYVPLWALATHLTFGDIGKFYACMKPQNRQSVSKRYKMPDNDLSSIIKLLTHTRNSCAHGNRLYCIKTNDLPLPDQANYSIQFNLIKVSNGQHKLFTVLIAMKYFMSGREYKAFINRLSTIIVQLEIKLKTIHINTILDIMGFPQDWKLQLEKLLP